MSGKRGALLKVYSAGSNTGLGLLLKVGQEDYCGSFAKYNGAEFYVQIHDQVQNQLHFKDIQNIS